MRKFDRRRVGSYYSERIGSSMEDKGGVEVQEQGRECKSEIFMPRWVEPTVVVMCVCEQVCE